MGLFGTVVGLWATKKTMDVMKVKDTSAKFHKATDSKPSKGGINYSKETDIGGA